MRQISMTLKREGPMRREMRFGASANGRSLKKQFDERPRPAEAYDRNGFCVYRPAEHHATRHGPAIETVQTRPDSS